MRTRFVGMIAGGVVAVLGLGLAGCTPPRQGPSQLDVMRGATGPQGDEVRGGQALHGPYPSLEGICGQEEAQSEAEAPLRWVRYARCTAEGQAELEPGSGLEAVATLREPGAARGILAVRTRVGWFVEEIPDGVAPLGGMGQHSPSSSVYDAASSHLEGGAVRLVLRGGEAHFVPGQGNLGSTSSAWTQVRRCALVETGQVPEVRCTASEEVWRRSCAVSSTPVPVQVEVDEDAGGAIQIGPIGEQTCQEQGVDVAPPG